MFEPIHHKLFSSLTLQLTDSCNLGCDYCFAKDNGLAGQYISEENYAHFIGFCLRSRMHSVRFTGGEPMLHPHFNRFVHLAVRSGMAVHMFSNFVVRGGIRGVNVHPNAVNFLVNINDRSTYTDENWASMQENLDLATKKQYRIVLAYTARTSGFDLSHIKELSLNYGVERIRISPAKPMINIENNWMKNDEIAGFATSMFDHCQEFAALGIKLILDCPIPLCHIPPVLLPFFLSNLKLSGRCNFGVSVDTNLDVGHCYITNCLLERRSLQSFKDITELNAYMKSVVSIIETECALFTDCKDCNYFSQGLCAAGCYGVRYRYAEHVEN